MAKSGNVELLVVRSGRTEWDDAGRLQGRTDLPLSEAGRQDLLQTLPEALSSIGGAPVGAVITAPDEASRETAAVVANHADVRSKVNDELAAMKLGLWEGLLEEDVLERHPSCAKAWREDPGSINVPEGETLQEVEVRLLGVLSKIAEKANGKAVAVVLRPIEYGLMRCYLGERPTTDLWTMIEDGPLTERRSVPRTMFRTLLEQLKARA